MQHDLGHDRLHRGERGDPRRCPGSNLADDRLQFRREDSIPAEMEKGSVLFYTGSVYHGGAANRSDAVRMGLNLTYVVSWLRQEENQYLSVPREDRRHPRRAAAAPDGLRARRLRPRLHRRPARSDRGDPTRPREGRLRRPRQSRARPGHPRPPARRSSRSSGAGPPRPAPRALLLEHQPVQLLSGTWAWRSTPSGENGSMPSSSLRQRRHRRVAEHQVVEAGDHPRQQRGGRASRSRSSPA